MMRKLVCLLALALLLVACQSNQASNRPISTAAPKPGPTATPTPTATPSPTTMPTQVLPTQPPPAPTPTWTVSPTQLAVQTCPEDTYKRFICTLTITYDSRGTDANATWKAYAMDVLGLSKTVSTLVNLSPMEGTLTASSNSVQVSVYVFDAYCQPQAALVTTVTIDVSGADLEPAQPSGVDEQTINVACSS